MIVYEVISWIATVIGIGLIVFPEIRVHDIGPRLAYIAYLGLVSVAFSAKAEAERASKRLDSAERK